MKQFTKIAITFLMAVMVFTGCQLHENDDIENSKKENAGFEKFLEDNNFEAFEEGYVYEGDVFFSKDVVDALYENNKETRGNIAISSTGTRWVWNSSEKMNITFRFATNMATNDLTDTQVRNAVRAAANAWNAVGGIRLQEVTSGGTFTVQLVTTASPYAALSFFPHSGSTYTIRLYKQNLSNYTTYTRMVGLFTHEIGHSLGLAHEHQRADSPNKYNQVIYGEAFGLYDANSVMNYANSPYTSGISIGDRRTIRFLYQDIGISNVANTYNWINDMATQTMTGDFNGDGRMDIALRRSGWASIPVYFSNGAGGYNVTNYSVAYNWINDMDTQIMLGDYNNDGRMDIALRRSSWGSIPVYFSNGNGTFTIRNYSVAYNWINDMNTQTMLGDYNNDGRMDIALRRSSWASIPVYFSNGNGTFTITNYNVAYNWINDMSTQTMLGDYNNDGRMDIALRRSGWASIPMYLSNGNGTFTIRNYNVAYNWINDMNTQTMLGDYNNDGRMDIALRRSGWASIPVYFSNGNGTFTITNYGNKWNWINDMSTQFMIGDFNADGLTDIALRRSGWASIPTYFSNGNGSFGINNKAVPYNWINDMNTRPMVGDFDNDGKTEIVLRRSGWGSLPQYHLP